MRPIVELTNETKLPKGRKIQKNSVTSSHIKTNVFETKQTHQTDMTRRIDTN